MGTPDYDSWPSDYDGDRQPSEPHVPVEIPRGELDDDFDSETSKYVYTFTGAAMFAAISVIAYKRLRDRRDG